LAAVLDEIDVNEADGWVSGACIGAVNLSEVIARLFDAGFDANWIEAALSPFDLDVVPFDHEQSLLAGGLRPLTRHRGLSLGDRACLALAKHLGRPAITADRAWADLDCGVPIEVIR
jgi:PIN domain nuclease of toxin-antitoxin system